MSCNYAEGLSPYENKGKLGLPEKFDSEDAVNEKCALLGRWIKDAQHVVVHTGAGISTAAGIPDFRGPKGVWTLEQEGKTPTMNISFAEAVPTFTHLALKRLLDQNLIQYIVSQNIDGLHLRTGVSRRFISELHGNMFVEQCNSCDSQFVRATPTPSVGKKCLNTNCKRYENGRICRGKLSDTILDWEHSLPEKDLDLAYYHSSIADLNVCLGTTLQIVPSGNLPLKNKKFGGRFVIANLQPTKHDRKADLIINTYVDDIFRRLMAIFELDVPEYQPDLDPIHLRIHTEWNIHKRSLKDVIDVYNVKNKALKKVKKRDNEVKDEENIPVLKQFKKEEEDDDADGPVEINGDEFKD